MGDRMCQCGHYESDHGADGSCDSSASTGYCPCFIFDDSDAQPDPRDAEIAALKAAQDGIHAVGYREGVLAERQHSLKATADGNAEIARLKAEVATLRVDHERAIKTLTASGVALDVHSTMSMTTHVESVVSQARDLLRENQALRLDLAAHKRALAAGPAALRAVALQARAAGETPLADGALDCAAMVEAAQEAAMREGT